MGRSKKVPLLEALSQKLDSWLANPPLLSSNEWVKGPEGQVYIRYNTRWDQIDLATFSIKEKHQGRGIMKAILTMACQKSAKSIQVECIQEEWLAKKLASYVFPGRETVSVFNGLTSNVFYKKKT